MEKQGIFVCINRLVKKKALLMLFFNLCYSGLLFAGNSFRMPVSGFNQEMNWQSQDTTQKIYLRSSSPLHNPISKAVIYTINPSGIVIYPALYHSVYGHQEIPVIIQHPVSQTNCKGNQIKFSVTVQHGTPPYAFQWQRKHPGDFDFTDFGIPLSGEIQTHTLTVNNIGVSNQNVNGTQYRAVVTDHAGHTVISNPSILTVNSILGYTPPAKTRQSVCPGGDISFGLRTDGNNPVSWQWIKHSGPGVWANVQNGNTISGATSDKIEFTQTALADAGRYRARVVFPKTPDGTFCQESYETERILSVLPGEIGRDQVIAFNTVPSRLEQVSVEFDAALPLSYQWQASADGSTGWTDIPAATAAVYSPPALEATVYYRRLVNSDLCGLLFADPVQITVLAELVPGAITPVGPVCHGGTPAQLEAGDASGGTGNYTYQWESSPDGTNWTSIAGATSLNYQPPALLSNTWYRISYTDETPTSAVSNPYSITVNPAPTLTSVNQQALVCEGNSATIQLTGLLPGSTFTISYSISGTAQTPISGVTSDPSGNGSFPTVNLTASANGQTLQVTGITITSATPECSASFTEGTSLSVNSLPAGPTSATAGTADLCTGQSTALTLNGGGGGTGESIVWYSGSCGGTLAGTGNNLTVSPLATTTYYGRYETGVPCNQASACAEVTITVYPPSSGGSLSGSAEVCSGTNSTLLSLSGYTGDIVKWQFSKDGSTWTDIAHTGATFTASGLSETTEFRAVVQSGPCSEAVSPIATIFVNPNPVLTVTPVYQSITTGETIIPIVAESDLDGSVFTWTRDNTTNITGIDATGTGSAIVGALTSNQPTLDQSTVFSFEVESPEGCTSSILATVEILADTEEPVITCPPDRAVTTNNGCTATGVALGIPIVTDNGMIYSITSNAISAYPVGTTTVIWTATDFSGNTATCSQLVTVTDDDLPVINCSADIYRLTDAGVCQAVVTVTAPTASDNCGIQSVVNDRTGTATASGTYPVGQTVLIWTATDVNGNSSTCRQTVNVRDEEKPVVTCPSAISVPADPGSCNANVSLILTQYSDNCTIASVINSHNAGGADASGLYPIGITPVIFTVTDVANNITQCTVNVTVTDQEPPQVTCPVNIDIPSAQNECFADITVPAPAVSDNCGTVTFSNSYNGRTNASDTYPVGIHNVIWTATDRYGLTSTCIQQIIVRDTQPPVPVCPPTIYANVDAGTCQATGVSPGVLSHSDNCAVDLNSITNTAPAVYPVGTTTIIYRLSDINGNTASCSQQVIITDNSNPVISCPPNVAVTSDAGSCSATSVALGNAAATDPCGIATITNNAPSTFPAGVTTVIWTASDNNGNTATCAQTVTVTDPEPPVFVVCPAPLTVSADATQCRASGVDLGTPQTTDNCGIATLTNNAPVTFPLGNTTVTWTATDTSGNTTTCTQVVTVIDNTPPVPDIAVLPVVYGSVCVTTRVDPPTATDNCGVITATTSDQTIFPGNMHGTFTILWIYSDASGNSVSQTQTIIITPLTINPTPAVPNLPVIRAQCGYTFTNFPMAYTAQPCGDEITGSTLTLSFTTQGTHTVVWTYTDRFGNQTTQEQLVIIKDDIPPVVNCPAPISVPAAAGACETFVNIPPLTATDNCAIVTITNDRTANGANASGIYPVGNTLVTYLVTDAGGNTVSCSVNVTVVDNQKPVIICPPNIAVFNDPGFCHATLNDLTVSATDNCVNVTITNSYNSNGANADGIYTTGIHQVIFTASDQAGNTATCAVIVTVNDNEPPTADPLTDLGPFSCFSQIPAPNPAILTNIKDNCGGQVSANFLGDTGTGTCNYMIERKYRLTDSNGNTADIVQKIYIHDTTAPTANPLPSLGPYSCYAEIPAQNINVVTGRSDNCGGIVTVNFIDTDPDPGCSAVIYRRYQLADQCGNTRIITQEIIINDVLPPAISAIPATLTVNCGQSIPDMTVTATDLCDPAPVITMEIVSTTQTSNGSCSDFNYTVTRRWIATDKCGNTAVKSQTINFVDNQAPVITLLPARVYSCSESLSPNDLGLPVFTDNCDPNPSYSYVDIVSNVSCSGNSSIERVWTVTDACGNVTTARQILAVKDTESPAFSQSQYVYNVACPKDIPGPEAVKPTATDNCSQVTVTYVDAAYVGLEDAPGFCPTQITYVFQATDDCGNSATVNVVINVASTCDCVICPFIETPHIVVDLRSNPDSIWVSPKFRRNEPCCNEKKNINCASFTVLLHPSAINLQVGDIRGPSFGSETYQIDCGPLNVFGREACILDKERVIVTICKPGSEEQQITIRQIAGVVAPATLKARVGCSYALSVEGNVTESTVTWRDITGQGYERFLSPATGFNTTFTPDATAPSMVQYEVCGTIFGSTCLQGVYVCDIVTIQVFPAFTFELGGDLEVCDGETTSLTVTANPLGIYDYVWYFGTDDTGTPVHSESNVNASTFSPQAAGYYHIVAMEKISGVACNRYETSYQFIINPNPWFEMASGSVMCAEDDFHLILPAEYTYTWSPATHVVAGTTPNEFFIIPDFAGLVNYQVTATSSSGCTFTVPWSLDVRACMTCSEVTQCPDDSFSITSISEFIASGGTLDFPCSINNSSIELIDTNSTPGSCPQLVYYTYRIWDTCGNEASCTLTVTRQDNESPQLSGPADRTFEACGTEVLEELTALPLSLTNAEISLEEFIAAGGSASDNCTFTITYRDILTGTCPVTVTRIFFSDRFMRQYGAVSANYFHR
jgi:hypothetical protein